MSDAEAMVHLELEERRIPFSWRYFDGQAPLLKELIPDYAPEFTLREHRLVIVIVGEYFGSIPSVIDRAALAQAALEMDGWKVVSLFATDIQRDGPVVVLDRQCPELRRTTIRGGKRKSPYDPPTYFEGLRRNSSALALRRSKFALEEEQREKQEQPDGTSVRTRPRRQRRRPGRTRRRLNRSSGS